MWSSGCVKVWNTVLRYYPWPNTQSHTSITSNSLFHHCHVICSGVSFVECDPSLEFAVKPNTADHFVGPINRGFSICLLFSVKIYRHQIYAWSENFWNVYMMWFCNIWRLFCEWTWRPKIYLASKSSHTLADTHTITLTEIHLSL